MADKPVTREEKYLAYLTGDYKGEIPKPITRKEKYLYELCLKGIGGEISPEEIKNAVNEYLEKNPVKPGATTEQAQQIEQNKTDIASLKVETGSLKEDISNKITKFYASSQGETHLADSDNGKIQNTMLYGKSEQKQYSGKNIYYMDYEDYFQLYSGAEVTSTKFGYSVSGTFSGSGSYTLTNRYITLAPGTYKMLLKNISALKIGLSRRDYFPIVSIPVGKTDATFTLNKETEICLTITYANTTANEANEIMLTNNLESTSYEPYTGGQPSPSPDYPQEINSVVNPIVKLSNGDGTQFETVTLPYTLNAIPVESGGNVTIDGKQYIADYVDVERGKLVKMVDSSKLDNTQSIVNKTEWLLAEPQETDLTTEEITAFKALVTYYPTTNIGVNSEQLDGYTVFNYPVSMKNGWDYVKKQFNDNRDYIYNMDTKTQDIDTQAAEAYVNSEYAVALTELEV